MDVARIRRDAGTSFAVRENSDHQWVLLDDLGIVIEDTGELIAHSAEIANTLGSSSCARVGDEEVLGFDSPVLRPEKVVAIGLNYASHVAETKQQVPPAPVVFAKYPNSLNGPYDDVVIDPALTAAGDYEAELAVVIGREARHVSVEDARSAVFGYTVANDVSARDLQRADGQLSRSKSMDTFCPIGPWITTADLVTNPHALRVTSRVNGEVRQDGSTADLIFDVDFLVSYLSRTMTLKPGDVILTGTPSGVGVGMDPPCFLVDGDVVECEVSGLGRIANRIVSGGA